MWANEPAIQWGRSGNHLCWEKLSWLKAQSREAVRNGWSRGRRRRCEPRVDSWFFRVHGLHFHWLGSGCGVDLKGLTNTVRVTQGKQWALHWPRSQWSTGGFFSLFIMFVVSIYFNLTFLCIYSCIYLPYYIPTAVSSPFPPLSPYPGHPPSPRSIPPPRFLSEKGKPLWNANWAGHNKLQ